MKIVLSGEEEIRLEAVPGPLTIDSPVEDRQFSPFHMLAAGLATCTYSVLASWGSHAGIGAEDLAITVSWTFAEKPHRVGSIRMQLHWPSLPSDRAEAAKRASLLCPIHATLSHPPSIEIANA